MTKPKIKYQLTFPNRRTHFIHIEMTISNLEMEEMELLLPDWRPGRYELTNYVANIGEFRAFGNDGSCLISKKTKKNKWKLSTSGVETIIVRYSYYAFKMDAGNSYVDEEQIYINFINCLLYSPQHMNQSTELFIDFPKSYKSTCSLEYSFDNTFLAENYFEMVDSPFLASESIKKLTYFSSGTEFNILIQGDCPILDDKIVKDFKMFTDVQTKQMQGFPNGKFNFIIQSLAYRHYHGVEHKNSTVLVLGPNNPDNKEKYFQDLLGVASHELFHAWNVTRIRPKELLPYDFSKENYYETGFVTEGFTTYYGDLFLVRSGVFDEAQYFLELNALFKRHFENYGRHNLSITDSSFDLWIDGYKRILPNRKVSIYVKGAILALMLDLTIRRFSNDSNSLDDLIYELWLKFGKKEIGYLKQDVYDLISKYLGSYAGQFITDFYEGTTSLESQLSELSNHIGCELVAKEHPERSASLFGFRIDFIENSYLITEIAPKSQAEQYLSIGDKILAINGSHLNETSLINLEETTNLLIERNHKHRKVELNSTEK
ncbi:MAG: PDZ domain-containing protein, partial [Cyclobacteriaceae bacterium]|nr:PDZ domain-containing protein [Cyclobacteriaceae bacterium]